MPKPKNGKLTAKQEEFCRQYLIDLNGTQAAIRAGYSPKTARQIADENLSKPDIQAKIIELGKDRQARTEIAGDTILKRFDRIASFRLTDILDFDGNFVTYKPIREWQEAALEAVTAIKVSPDGTIEVKVSSKQAAQDSLAKALGLYTEFNAAIGCFLQYGMKITQDQAGRYLIEEKNYQSDSFDPDLDTSND